tara:strand:+ start:53 stop:694 length:642 start_codon:yes stop_codon:yes gene_type:complete
MATPSSGTISLNEMHVEAGGGSGTQCSINDSDIRLIANKSSGAQTAWGDYYSRAADWSSTMTVGDNTISESNGYVTVVTRFRGYMTSTAINATAVPSGGIGSMNDYQDSDYLANSVIDVLAVYGDQSGSSSLFRLQIYNGTISNNDTAFKSVIVNGTTFNRTDASFGQNNNADRVYTIWSWSLSAAVPDASSDAYAPFGVSGASNTITFRRSR